MDSRDDSKPLKPPSPTRLLEHGSSPPPEESLDGVEVEISAPSLDLTPSIPVPPPPAEPDRYVGTTVDGRYKIEAILGEGGMGVVYLARHKAIGKKMAIKVLRAELARTNREVTERFLQEARAASSIGNPHIIDISDFGVLPDGSAYFVMEYLDGAPLSKVLEETRPVPVPRLYRIARQICDGLEAAHQRGIVHRDLKPDNVFLVQHGSQEDFVKVLDFGIAKVSTSGSKITQAGAVFGTPHYMSPEQAAGSSVDHRTDVYALGVILYEMASGQVPFDADNFMGILTQHMYKAPVPIRALVPPREIPPGLEAIILKCLSKKPEQRYQSMQELASDLDQVMQGLVPEAVAEMMARSGSFHVPADFFQNRGMAEAIPATPLGLRDKKTRFGLYAGVAGVLTAIGIVVAIFARSSASTASTPSSPPPKAEVVKAAVAQSPAKPHAAAIAKEPEPPPSPEPSKVLFASEPLDAQVFRGGESLGQPPLTIEVPAGESVTVEVRRAGYEPQSLTVDGSSPRLTVTLVPEKKASKPPARNKPTKLGLPAKSKPKPTLGTNEIVNPWAK